MNIPGAVLFRNATQTGPPPVVKLIIPSINPSVAVVMYAFVTRPPNGGGMSLVNFATADGTFATIDLHDRYGIEDAFGASPFLSDFTQTVKAMVNAKPTDTANGNDRIVFPIDSGIFAYEPPRG